MDDYIFVDKSDNDTSDGTESTETTEVPYTRPTTAQIRQNVLELKEKTRKKLEKTYPEYYLQLESAKETTSTEFPKQNKDDCDHNGGHKFMNLLRNIIAIIIGLIVYIALEYVLVWVISLIASLPILSYIITGIVPLNVFVAGTLPFVCIPATLSVMNYISIYKDKNYPAIIVLVMLLLLLIYTTINNFSASNFISLLIQGSFFLFGIATCSDFDKEQ